MNGKSDNNTIYVAMIGGLVTIVATVVSAIIAPVVVDHLKSTPEVLTTTQPNSLDQFIRAYYQGINERRYEYTWSLLSDDFKAINNGPDQGEYQGYVAYWNTVDHVEIVRIDIQSQSSQYANVYVVANYIYKDGRKIPSTNIFDFKFDSTRNTWLFDI